MMASDDAAIRNELKEALPRGLNTVRERGLLARWLTAIPVPGNRDSGDGKIMPGKE